MSVLIRQTRALSWGLFFGMVLAAWGALFLMSASLPDAELSRIYGAEFWLALCQVNGLDSGIGVMVVMWALMAAAMMMPTFAPTVQVFNDLTHTSAASGVGMFMLVLGYLVVWLGFSIFAATAQYLLLKQGLVSPVGSSLSLGLNAVLLLMAGAYQFSKLKEACLNQCRAPLTYFIGAWRDGPFGAMNMGLRLGLICLGCCWALMVLAFVGGTMNLLWMGLATVVMVVEKLPDLGRYVTRPLGGALILAGAATAIFAIF